MSDDHEPFIIFDDEDVELGNQADEGSLKDALQNAGDARDSGLITEDAYLKIDRKVQLFLAKAHKVVGDIEGYLDRCRRAEEARKAEEVRKRKEEEERKRREEDARKAEAERKRKEQQAREAEQERKRQEAAEAALKAEEERKRRALEEAMKEPPLTWRELESIAGRTRTIGLDQGAFQVKQMYEEALAHKDWASFAQHMRTRYRQDELPWTLSQISKSGLLKEMANIFPPDEINPVVVPGYMIVQKSPLSEEKVFVVVNVQSPDRFRYSPASIVPLSQVQED
jgi:hypothetical protein